jgi:hypothetical protein
MRKKIGKLYKRLHNRHNITAVGIIVIIAGISFALSFLAFDFFRFQSMESAKEKRHSAYEDELRKLSGITVNLAPVPDPTADWKTYESQRYYFSVKYPKSWPDARESYAGKGENHLMKISFDEKGIVSKNGVKGFDVYIYSATKFPGPMGTDNLKKINENPVSEDCPLFDDITLGEKGYPAKEVDISLENPCWETTFFYSLTNNGFTYNIIPRNNKNRTILTGDEELALSKTYAEFYDIVSTIDLEKTGNISKIPGRIMQKVTSPPKPRYTTGARCPEKNDHPRNSKTKGKHMDEDCCPDPDEWPNPRCAYSAGGLNLMRAKPKK